ncbi:hypothetical protein D3C84_1037170 [compost metagenome]
MNRSADSRFAQRSHLCRMMLPRMGLEHQTHSFMCAKGGLEGTNEAQRVFSLHDAHHVKGEEESEALGGQAEVALATPLVGRQPDPRK